MMKILQIGPVPIEAGGRAQGGIASHVWDLSRQLSNHGHKVAILGDNVDHTKQHPRCYEGVQIFGLQNTRQALRSGRWLNPQFWRKFWFIWRYFDSSLQGRISILRNLTSYLNAVNTFKPDIIHVHRLQIEFVYAYATTNRLPLVTTVHSAHAVEFAKTARLREHFSNLIHKNLLMAGPLIFVSSFTHQQYQALFPEPMKDVSSTVIHNPVQGEHYSLIERNIARQQSNQPLDSLIVLSAGTLIRRKRFDVLIKIIAEIKYEEREKPLLLLIAGSGPLQHELEQQIQALDATDFISLIGERSQKELVNDYNAADVFVLTSEMESFGLVYFEAMLCGCPVIGTPTVMREIVTDESCGFYVPLSDKIGLKNAIRQALQQDWNRQAIRQYALQFDWPQRLEQFEALYQQAITNGRR